MAKKTPKRRGRGYSLTMTVDRELSPAEQERATQDAIGPGSPGATAIRNAFRNGTITTAPPAVTGGTLTIMANGEFAQVAVGVSPEDTAAQIAQGVAEQLAEARRIPAERVIAAAGLARLAMLAEANKIGGARVRSERSGRDVDKTELRVQVIVHMQPAELATLLDGEDAPGQIASAADLQAALEVAEQNILHWTKVAAEFERRLNRYDVAVPTRYTISR